MMENELFLIDANSLITPYLTFYSFDLAKTFWNQMEWHIQNGNIAILDLVKLEVLKGKDSLKEWMENIEVGQLIDLYRPPKVRPKSNDLEVGIFMAKYSFEFKKKVVLEYLDGKGGVLYLFKIYGLASGSQLRKWINAYNAFGDEGLMRSRKQIKYSFEKKISIVELYLSSETSQERSEENFGHT